MKNLKLSFALIIAVLAIGTTVATKANFFGKRVLTRCFNVIELRDASGTASTAVTLNVASPITCQAAKNLVNGSIAPIKPYIHSASVAASFTSEESCPAQNYFCCAKLVEVLPGDPGFSATPQFNLGEGLKKYKIANEAAIYCKLTQQ